MSKIITMVMMVVILLIGPLQVHAYQVVSLTTSVSTKTLAVNDIFSPEIKVIYSNGSSVTLQGSDLEWSIDDPSIASVADGHIMGRTDGTTVVTGSYAGEEVDIVVTVGDVTIDDTIVTTSSSTSTTTPIVVGLAPTISVITMYEGSQIVVGFIATMSDGTTKNVTSQVSYNVNTYTGIAYNGQTSVLYGIGVGDYVLTASYNGLTTTVTVYVRSNPNVTVSTPTETKPDIVIEKYGFNDITRKVEVLLEYSVRGYTLYRQDPISASWDKVDTGNEQLIDTVIPGSYRYKVVDYYETEKIFEIDVPEYFSDVKFGEFGYSEIYTMASRNLIDGDGTGKFLPDNNVTRAEVSKMLANMLGKSYGYLSNPYIDAQGHWAERYISIMVEEGLFKGVSDTKFNTEGLLTGYELATVLERLAGSYSKGDGVVLDDAPSWAVAGSKFVAGNALYSGDMLRKMSSPLTRAETIFAIAKTLDLKEGS